MTRLALFAAALATLAITLVVHTNEAEACGGCFAPPETVTTVDSHRMVISLNLNRTILWDQIQYTGNPEDFAWVLPVPTPEALVEVADNQFFEDLERSTQVTVSAPSLPPLDCPPPPGDWGSGFQDASAASADAGGVEVYQEEVVGPYEMVVIGSDDPMALYDWLIDHGYSVPTTTLPVIQFYVEDGHKFVALRLAPDQGVDRMQPIRVSYPGYMASFPLKMVTVGAYGSLNMTLWVVAEQRYGVHNYGTGTIDEQDLVWDFDQRRSNYGQLFNQTIYDLGGAGWVAEYANSLNSIWFEAWAEAELATNDHPFPYITRLRTRVNVDNLGEDMLLAPSMDASNISPNLQASQSINAPNRSCPDYNGDGVPDTWDDYNASSDDAGAGGYGALGDNDDDDHRGWSVGCSVGRTSAAPITLLLTLGALLLTRQRRR